MVGSFAMLIVFDAAFRAMQRAITRPARETLFTVVSREDKYKSKAFIDTFVYRGGDLLGAWTEGWLGQLGPRPRGRWCRWRCRWPACGRCWAMWLGRRQETMSRGGAGLRTRRRPRLGACVAGQRPGLKTRPHW